MPLVFRFTSKSCLIPLNNISEIAHVSFAGIIITRLSQVLILILVNSRKSLPIKPCQEKSIPIPDDHFLYLRKI